MWGWFRRQAQRERDLEADADADLVRDNRRRMRLSWKLIGFGFLIASCPALFHFDGWVKELCFWMGMALLIVGFVVARWAGEEYKFLHRPDPPKPPSLFGRD